MAARRHRMATSRTLQRQRYRSSTCSQLPAPTARSRPRGGRTSIAMGNPSVDIALSTGSPPSSSYQSTEQPPIRDTSHHKGWAHPIVSSRHRNNCGARGWCCMQRGSTLSGPVLRRGMQSTQHHKMLDPCRKSDGLPLSSASKLEHSRV